MILAKIDTNSEAFTAGFQFVIGNPAVILIILGLCVLFLLKVIKGRS
ncbi:hypothetical protein [Aneurinibacillus aneurinilyticus]